MEQNKSTNDTKSHKGTVNTPMKKNLKEPKRHGRHAPVARWLFIISYSVFIEEPLPKLTNEA